MTRARGRARHLQTPSPPAVAALTRSKVRVRIGTDFWGMIVAEIRLQEGESIENALRRFKRKVQTEEIIKEVKRHSFYLKPGAKRRLKQALARKRARKKTRKDSDSARKD
jgi:small subunit ribosomal protein S21